MRISSAFDSSVKMRQWHLSEKFAFLLAILVVAALLTWPLWQRKIANAEMNDLTQRSLERSFVKIQPTKRGALMTPREISHFNILSNHDDSFENWRGQKPVSIGFTFNFPDRHFHAKYHIIGIDKDGILVQYDYRGYRPAREGHFTGTVKLKWK